jgi:hypothetical protein
VSNAGPKPLPSLPSSSVNGGERGMSLGAKVYSAFAILAAGFVLFLLALLHLHLFGASIEGTRGAKYFFMAVTWSMFLSLSTTTALNLYYRRLLRIPTIVQSATLCLVVVTLLLPVLKPRSEVAIADHDNDRYPEPEDTQVSGSDMGVQGQPLPEDVLGLINALASPNKLPKEGWEVIYPKGYDRAAQDRVLAAEEKLVEKGVDAFPELVKHIADARYSQTTVSAEWYNISVGAVCRQIIKRQVLPKHSDYKSRKGTDGEYHMLPNYMDEQGGFKQWWSTRSKMSLHEMKVEALKWKIEREKEIGSPDPEDRKYILEPLQAELRELQKESE